MFIKQVDRSGRYQLRSCLEPRQSEPDRRLAGGLAHAAATSSACCLPDTVRAGTGAWRLDHGGFQAIDDQAALGAIHSCEANRHVGRNGLIGPADIAGQRQCAVTDSSRLEAQHLDALAPRPLMRPEPGGLFPGLWHSRRPTPVSAQPSRGAEPLVLGPHFARGLPPARAGTITSCPM